MRVLSVVFALLFLAGVIAAQAPASKPAAQAPASKPAAQAPASKPAAQAPASKPAAQAPASKPAAQAPASKPARAAASKPDGTLAQLMRGILFPNSNILFDAQQIDPGAPKAKTAAGAETGPASSAFANIYTGWQVVENAAIALQEAADLIMKPGRLCENGKPVPVQRADFVKFAQNLRNVSRAALMAARTKNQEKVSDVTNDVADACLMCHEIYREAGDAKSPNRCVAHTPK